MGYCFDDRGRLVCDNCGTAGGCRKVRCKYGYCQSPALCERCRKDPVVKEKIRDHCESNCREAAAKFAERERQKQAALDAGLFLRCAAVNDGDGMVKVTFRNKAGDTVDRRVTTEVYRARGLLEVTTFADYGLEAAA